MSLVISFDIEANGPTPVNNSMISFGCATYTEDGELVSTFYRTIKPLDGHIQNTGTMKFWNSNPKQYALTKKDAMSATQFVADLAEYLHGLGNKFVWVARPSAFDWMWLKCYYEQFKKSTYPEVGYSCHCITSSYKQYITDNKLSKDEDNQLWEKLTKDCIADHHPVNDAKYQGAIYFGIKKLSQ